MSEQYFVTVFALQKAEIEHFCFGKCGKVIMAMLEDAELGFLSPCKEAACPYLDAQINEPFGVTDDGKTLIIRKLIDLPTGGAA